MHDLLKVEDVIADLVLDDPERAYIDVRSELEFDRGSIPHFVNAPILYQSERHEVGTAYKQQGQEAAIELGHKLVDPHRDQRVNAWLNTVGRSKATQGVLMCWRGGLRSKLASEWASAAGADILQLVGGYKALRHQLLLAFEQPMDMLMLSGLTGSGKTDLLLEFPDSAIDLEGAAGHRGSVFGAHWDEAPVAQATFENTLALKLQRHAKIRLVEDESRMIGPIYVPDPLFIKMKAAPLVILDDDRESRVERIWLQYIVTPLAKGKELRGLERHFLNALSSLRKPLDARYNQIEAAMRRAFTEGADLKSHSPWIDEMLEHYYDKRYQHGLDKSNRIILFRGNRVECREFLLHKLA